MIKKFLLGLFICYSSFASAETIKTDVLVIGGTASGAAAAIQSARSKVKTLWVMQGKGVDIGKFPDLPDDIVDKLPKSNGFIVPISEIAQSGIYGEFSSRVKAFYKNAPGYDTAATAQLKFEKFTCEAILKGIADTVKNLTIKVNAAITGIKKEGNGWEVNMLLNGKSSVIKAKVLVDATKNLDMVTLAGVTIPSPFYPNINNTGNLYRTSIAIADYATSPPHSDMEYYLHYQYGVPLKYAIVNNSDNFLVTSSVTALYSVFYIPIQISVGQGVGCIAAYCAFFKTTTKDLKPRLIQQELLDFKGLLLPFTDINPDDKYIRAVQQIGATGLLKGKYKGNDLLFMPDEVVTTAEIKPVLTEIYSRAFLWFDKEKPGDKFTVGNTLSLISEFTLTDPETLKINMQKEWQDKYKFTRAFDINRPITRLEFAVLMNKYLNPFARKIDLDGNMIN